MLQSSIHPYCHALIGLLWLSIASTVFPFLSQMDWIPGLFIILYFHQKLCDKSACVYFPREDAVWEFLQPSYLGVKVLAPRNMYIKLFWIQTKGALKDCIDLLYSSPRLYYYIWAPSISFGSMLSSALLFTSYYPILSIALFGYLGSCYSADIYFSLGFCV